MIAAVLDELLRMAKRCDCVVLVTIGDNGEQRLSLATLAELELEVAVDG